MKPQGYGTYRRSPTQLKTTLDAKQRAREAFSQAWRDGTKFMIAMGDDGNVKISVGGKTVAIYRDPQEFEVDFFS